MADDNRLLRVMLEEELGMSLEVYEHPLKQAFGALVGGIAASLLCLFAYWAAPSYALPIASVIVIIVATWVTTKLERNRSWPTIVWNLALATAASGCIYFLILLLGRP